MPTMQSNVRPRAVCDHGVPPGAPCVDCAIDIQIGLLELHIVSAQRSADRLAELYAAKRGNGA
jgi:hypothetical protein